MSLGEQTNASWECTKVLRESPASRPEKSPVSVIPSGARNLSFVGLRSRDLLRRRSRRVVSVSRLNDQFLRLRGQRNLVIARPCIFFRGIRQAILIAQIFLDLRIYFVQRFFFLNFVQSSARGFRNLLQNFLSVRPLFLWISSSAPPASPLAHCKSAARPVFFVILE